MNNVYEYLLTIFNVLVGLVTTERLIYASLIALGIYVIWVVVSLLTSFQRKFNSNCSKLYNFIKKNQINATNLKIVDLKIDKISSGFAYGWKNYKSSTDKKPSDFITRREALDVEVSGGVLNQGKTLMRAYINIITVLLFIINLAYRGAESKVTAYLIAETMILPFIFYAVIKIFYFLYTSIKQQIYKLDIESFYELVDLLDATFAGVRVRPFDAPEVADYSTTQTNEVLNEEGTLERAEVATGEEPEAENPEEPQAEQVEEEEEVKLSPEELASQKYDFFKKKNIDVDKLVSEVPTKGTKTSLPYINVDSEYVITDAVDEQTAKIVGDIDNGADLLGGMMQDMSSIKKANAQAEEKSAENKKEEPVAEEKIEEKTATDSNDPFASLDAFEVVENAIKAETEEKKDESVEPVAEEKTAEPSQTEEVKTEEPVVEEQKVEEPQAEPVEEPVPEPTIEDKKADIANIVGGFKTNKSKLASGGVVIERNTPISKREQPSTYLNSSINNQFETPFQKNSGVTQLDLPDSANNVLNTMKGANNYEDYDYQNQGYADNYSNQGYNQGYQGYGVNQQYVPPISQGYSVPTYQGPITGQFGGYGSAQFSQNGFNQINQNPYNAPVTPVYEQEFNDFEEEEVQEFEEVQPKPQKKTAKKEVKEESKPKSSKKKVEKVEVMEEQKKRGRPKKQVFDETLTIKDDKEFDSVLARAEKLMRKSDEGLSQSQSKRIEKELKMLMDAMNKYKEGK